MRHILSKALLFLSAFSSLATTFYVSPSGSDSANGSSGTPWQTISHAVATISGGDTVMLNNGVYSGVYSIGTTKNGTLGAPTVFKAINPLMVTNQGAFQVSQGGAGYIEWHDIILQDSVSVSDWSGILQFWHSSSGAALGAGFVVSNCWFVGTTDPTTHNIIGLNMDAATNAAACAQNFQLLRCVFTNMSQYEISIMASNGLVANCRFDFANTHDAIHCWGQNITISNNVFTNISANPLVSDHTDILQYWNDSSTQLTCSNVYFCYNKIINCDAQMFELQADGNCSWNYTNAGQLHIDGLYVFNCLYVNVDRPGYISIPNVHFYNDLWYHCRQDAVGGGSTAIYFAGVNNSCGIGTGSISNCAFVDCGNSNYVNDTHNGWFNSGGTGAFSNFVADYNFVVGDTTNWTAKNTTDWTDSGTMNAHSVNGGNPRFRAALIGDFHLATNSPMVDVGIPTTLFTQDLDGYTRPFGAGWDIGPYEFDPNLLVLLNPATVFSTGTLTNITGGTNHGVRMSSTNWPYQTNISGRYGAVFTAHSGRIDGGTDVGWGDYVAITNTTGLQNLTAGAVTFWAMGFPVLSNTGIVWDNQVSVERVFDCGYQGMSWSAGTFFIGHGFSPKTGANNQMVLRAYTTDGLANPNTLLTWPDRSSDGNTTNFHFYAATWDGTNVYAYWDGLPVDTNSMGAASYKMTNDFNWIGLGCWTHDGTPQWQDSDDYPNNGWWNGAIGETRIYSRALSSTEVYNLSLDSGGGNAAASIVTPTISHTPHFGTGIRIGTGVSSF